MGLLTQQKKIHQGQFTKTGKTGTLANAGSSIVGEEFLFSGLKKNMMMTSMGGGSLSSTGFNQTTAPLKMILEQRPLTKFEISGANVSSKMPVNEVEDNILGDNQGLQAKIKSLLDQRKPPTEQLPSLCDLYDENLNSA